MEFKTGYFFDGVVFHIDVPYPLTLKIDNTFKLFRKLCIFNMFNFFISTVCCAYEKSKLDKNILKNIKDEFFYNYIDNHRNKLSKPKSYRLKIEVKGKSIDGDFVKDYKVLDKEIQYKNLHLLSMIETHFYAINEWEKLIDKKFINYSEIKVSFLFRQYFE